MSVYTFELFNKAQCVADKVFNFFAPSPKCTELTLVCISHLRPLLPTQQ